MGGAAGLQAIHIYTRVVTYLASTVIALISGRMRFVATSVPHDAPACRRLQPVHRPPPARAYPIVSCSDKTDSGSSGRGLVARGQLLHHPRRWRLTRMLQHNRDAVAYCSSAFGALSADSRRFCTGASTLKFYACSSCVLVCNSVSTKSYLPVVWQGIAV